MDSSGARLPVYSVRSGFSGMQYRYKAKNNAIYNCVWEGNAYTDVRILGDSYFYSHLPLSRLQRGVSPGQTPHTPNFVLMQAHF